MAKIDNFALRVNIGKNSKFKSLALSLAEEKLEKEKSNLLSEFNSHAVTKEIDAGASSSNVSGTLGGYGNLFSFIGFLDGSNPTQAVRDLISKIRLIRSSAKSDVDNSGSIFSFKINAPSIDSFKKNTPMPWAIGRSWLIGIEYGISGFGYFINKALAASRSGGGIQVDNKLRSSSFKRTSYFQKIYSAFFNKISRGRP